MKCFQCGTDNNLKDRTGNQGRCKNCNHPFAFEPTSMQKVKFTDSFFAKAIADISVNNTLCFTPRQFLYFLDRRLKKKAFNLGGFLGLYIFFSLWTTLFFGGFLSIILGGISFPLVWVVYNFIWLFYLFYKLNSPESGYQTRQSSAKALQILGIVILVIGLPYSLFINSAIGYFIIILTSASSFWLGILQKRRLAQIADQFLITGAQISGHLDTWTSINNTIAKLLPKPQINLPNTTENNSPNPDITAYSFDRLVVCSNAEIAQMLIANNFHFENNCAILSITGYPTAIFNTVLQMLRRNPQLLVYAFHDASPRGVGLVHQLRTNPAWFQDSNIAIIDLGLLPRQVLANRPQMFVHCTTDSATAAKQLKPEIRQNLTADELAWLDAGNYVELESFTPQQLLRILNRGLAGSREIDLSDPSTIIWVGDSDNSIYLVESFG